MASQTPYPQSQILREIDLLLQSVPGAREETRTIAQLLDREADTLVRAHNEGHPGAAYLVLGDKYRPGESAATDTEKLDTPLSMPNARECMKRWHGFEDTADAVHRETETVDPRFESACDAIVAGNADTLRSILEDRPSLVLSRSPFAHHQTLLQHVSANGIEHNRQWQSPPNAVEIATILLEAGSEPDATCDSYGDSTAITLLVTSAHPAAAGAQGDLVEVLCAHGALPDGPADDGRPLCSAIINWYSDAAEALVRCGARVDNLLLAGAADDLEGVKSYFDEFGELGPARAYSWGRSRALANAGGTRTPLVPEHMLEYAAHWAAVHKRRDVVDYLLTKGPDPRIKEPLWNHTLLECAKYGGDARILELVRPLFDKDGEPI